MGSRSRRSVPCGTFISRTMMVMITAITPSLNASRRPLPITACSLIGAASSPRMLLEQAFLLQRLLHRRARLDASLELLQVREAREVHLHERRPTRHGVEVRIGGRELVVDEVLLRGE